MKNPHAAPPRGIPSHRATCEAVTFAEVEYERPPKPGLMVEFSGGLRLLVEDATVVDLAAEFIAAFRAHERKGGRS